MDNYSDEQLIELMGKDETKRNAFHQLVRKYQPRMYSLIRRMVVDHDDARDVLQNALLKIWEKWSSFRGEAPLSAWILRIASNEALMFLRSQKIRRTISLSSNTNYLESKLEASSSISADKIHLVFQKALLKLTDRQRLIFNMKFHEEMKYDEMAAILNVATGTLKATYHTAVMKVQQFLTESQS